MRIDKTFLQDPTIFQENRLPASASLRHYVNKEEFNKNQSSFYTSLNGYWKFHYANSLNDCIEEFYKEDFDCSTWDDIQVPGHIQMQGYGSPMYVNQIYPWSGTEEIKPGEIPNVNPIGSYVTHFDSNVLKENTDTIITFHGVESAFALWINGTYVGYSEDSFTPSSFDITKFIKNGKNKVAVNVYRFSSGSWLEDQDFWRFSGIFRDVEIQSIPQVTLKDLRVITNLSDSYKHTDIQLIPTIQGNASYQVTYSLYDKNTLIAKKDCETSEEVVISFDHPKLWSAEIPNLYHLDIEITVNGKTMDFVRQNIGIREFKMINNIMCINGKRIVFHGVNRHEFSAETGRVVSYELTKQDILNMKADNINAIRTSHYPNQTFLYDLCDEYGLYVIDETNMETHGTWSEGFDPDNIIPNDKEEWLEIILDRATSMVQRDKNHPSILIFSCGNESFGGKNIFEMSQHIRQLDPTRLVHYEGIANDNRYPDTSDMYSRMYTPAKEVEQFLREHTEKPFILCEYAHAMGNSNGALYKYTDLEKKYENYQGGFIWDYVDQALYHDGKLLYGGDFRERPSDYDFCGNGIMFADRTTTPKLQEVKYCYQNIGIEINSSKITFKNWHLFTNLCDYIVLVSYQINGRTIDKKQFTIDCEPGKEETMENPFSNRKPKENEIHSILVAILNVDRMIAQEQFVYPYVYEETHKKKEYVTTEDYLNIGVHGDGFNVIFSKQKGLVSYKVHGKEFIRRPLRPNFFRAATNNDVENQYGYRYGEWLSASLYAKCKYISYEKKEDHCLVQFAYSLPNIAIPLTMNYEIYGTGEIVIDMNLEGTDNHIEMPVFGILLETYPELNDVEYFGLGPDENYIDRQKGAILGHYKYNVQNNVTPYLYPQECGNRCKVFSTTVKDLNHALSIQGNAYDCSVLPYTPYELENAKHQWELPQPYQTVIAINEKQMGIAGDNTWGARTHDEFLLSKGNHHLRVTLCAK